MVRSVFSWFRKKKPPPETSPGGSVIRRYEAPSGPRIGFTEEAAKFREARESVYGRHFGEATKVWHELIPLIPHIDVYTYARRYQDRDFYTLITGGMSDLEMTLPAEAKGKGAARRVELIFYCWEAKEEYLKTINGLAHFPHEYKTWIGPGHTVPNGNPPSPLWGSSVLDTVLFLHTILTRDAALSDELKLAGEPVGLLWVVPLTTPECNLKLEKGSNAILDLLGQHHHPFVFDPDRKSYV
jgi:hypothetical protein